MSDTVVVVNDSDSDDTSDLVETAVVADAISDDGTDAVLDATTIGLVDRMARMEVVVASLSEMVQQIAAQIEGLKIHEEMQDERQEQTEEMVAEVASEAAEAVQEVVEDVDEASPEIQPDELPTVREHPFFRKWGKRS